MSPSKTSPDGCFRFDRVFRDVGRITCSSGTRRRADFRHRDALLCRLYDSGGLMCCARSRRAPSPFRTLCLQSASNGQAQW
jgi:hypothetical protein